LAQREQFETASAALGMVRQAGSQHQSRRT
jgi:hypothetical protein